MKKSKYIYIVSYFLINVKIRPAESLGQTYFKTIRSFVPTHKTQLIWTLRRRCNAQYGCIIPPKKTYRTPHKL